MTKQERDELHALLGNPSAVEFRPTLRALLDQVDALERHNFDLWARNTELLGDNRTLRAGNALGSVSGVQPLACESWTRPARPARKPTTVSRLAGGV